MEGIDYIGITICTICGLGALTIVWGCITENWTPFEKTKGFILKTLKMITNVSVNLNLKK